MQAVEELISFKKRFDEILLGKIEVWRREAKDLGDEYEVFMEVLADFVGRGGKRLRPAFLYYSYLACGGEDREMAVQAGVVLELLHGFLLIHDDMVDNSDLRRGGKTVHRLMEEEYSKLGLKGEGEEFGRSVAMILGDVVQMLAKRQLRELELERGVYRQCERLVERLLWETAYGWYIELLNTKRGKVSEDEVRRSMEYVSARYSVVWPVKMGALLAEAGKGKQGALESYGLKLGLAFQIQDDLLGMFGEREKVGKPVESDLREGKKTLLICKSWEKLEDEDKKNKLEKIYGNRAAKRENLEWVRGLMEELGVVEEVRNEGRMLAEEAKKKLDKQDWENEGERFLKGIASYIVEREV